MTTQTSTPGDRVHPDGTYHALPDPIADRIFAVVMALATEVWTLRDRMRLLEAALAEAEVDVEGYFQQHREEQAALAEMARDRDAFVARLLRVLTPADGS
jgi:cephalosporin-C deacetylase-like acetyl esterase